MDIPRSIIYHPQGSAAAIKPGYTRGAAIAGEGRLLLVWPVWPAAAEPFDGVETQSWQERLLYPTLIAPRLDISRRAFRIPAYF
jgi:hypothetical protein